MIGNLWECTSIERIFFLEDPYGCSEAIIALFYSTEWQKIFVGHKHFFYVPSQVPVISIKHQLQIVPRVFKLSSSRACFSEMRLDSRIITKMELIFRVGKHTLKNKNILDKFNFLLLQHSKLKVYQHRWSQTLIDLLFISYYFIEKLTQKCILCHLIIFHLIIPAQNNRFTHHQ